MSNQNLGLINKWLRHIKDVYRFYRTELDAIEDFDTRFNRLVELNVMEQIHNLAETSIIQKAWYERQEPMLHGWVYDMKTGHLKELTQLSHDSRIEDIYMYDFAGPKS